MKAQRRGTSRNGEGCCPTGEQKGLRSANQASIANDELSSANKDLETAKDMMILYQRKGL